MSLVTRLIGAVFVLFFTVSAALAVPAVTLSNAVGPPTSLVGVAATGFGANAAVDVYFDTAHLCVALANGAGAANCTIKVPSNAQPQAHFISAIQRNSGTGAQKAFTVRTDFTQFHGRNGAHTGVNPLENTITTSTVDDLEILWSAPIGIQGTAGAAVVAFGRVYVGGIDGRLYAFNATTGAAVAGFPVTIPAASINGSTPAVGGGRVFVGATDSRLHAFNAVTGVAVGAPFPIQLDPGVFVQSSPALALGNVYIGNNAGKLHAFNATTGIAVSGFPVTLRPGSVKSAPTIVGGKVYVGLLPNVAGTTFFGFDALTGIPASNFPKTLGNVQSTAAVSNGAVFVGTSNNNVGSFEVGSGLTIAGFPVGSAGPVLSSPAVAGGRVFFGSNDDKIYAYSVAGGAPVWSTPLLGDVAGSPVVANGVVYVNTAKRLYGLSQANGSILWTANVGGLFSNGGNSPTVANGIVYLGSGDGNLYAFSVNGEPAAAPLGKKPALWSLKPDLSLKPARTAD